MLSDCLGEFAFGSVFSPKPSVEHQQQIPPKKNYRAMLATQKQACVREISFFLSKIIIKTPQIHLA